jgi:NitT/TauT family transport system ATP-binding protein
VPKEERGIAQHYIDLVGLKDLKTIIPMSCQEDEERVGIARRMPTVRNSLMDELALFDAQTRNLMQGELLRIWEKEHISAIFVTHSVDEAVYLSDRVVVLSARPGTVKEIFKNDIPRPRIRTSPEANALRDAILKSLGSEIKASGTG